MKKCIKQSQTIFKQFLQTQGLDCDLKQYDEVTLDSLFRMFYASVRTKNGEHFKINSFQNLRYGLCRHILSETGIDVADSDHFNESLEVNLSVLVDLKRKVFGNTDHTPAITPEDTIANVSGNIPINYVAKKARMSDTCLDSIDTDMEEFLSDSQLDQALRTLDGSPIPSFSPQLNKQLNFSQCTSQQRMLNFCPSITNCNVTMNFYGVNTALFLIIHISSLLVPLTITMYALYTVCMVGLHMNRIFYALDGRLNKNDSGMWFLSFDHNKAYHLQRNSVLTKAKHPTCEGPYCGFPYKLPLLHLFDVRYVITLVTGYTCKLPLLHPFDVRYVITLVTGCSCKLPLLHLFGVRYVITLVTGCPCELSLLHLFGVRYVITLVTGCPCELPLIHLFDVKYVITLVTGYTCKQPLLHLFDVRYTVTMVTGYSYKLPLFLLFDVRYVVTMVTGHPNKLHVPQFYLFDTRYVVTMVTGHPNKLHVPQFYLFDTRYIVIMVTGYSYKLPQFYLFDFRESLYEAREIAPAVNPKVKVHLVGRTKIKPDVIRLTFHVTGPDHMTAYIDPVDGVSLIKWSLSEEMPKKTIGLPELNNSVYFIYYSHAEEPVTPWEFYIDLEVNPDHGNKAVLEIAFSGQYLHSENSRTKEIVNFINNLPEWTVPTVWACTYDSYQF
ncbi:hypothetical protein KUTeg_016584 [Tegillarca granosa]|uniref:Endoplasmic reticulum metallopeptidase 1-like C-terminal domain-containing protein n=1 Tax=Tegillarca granosa TaxID=220873 RepID=A0ABQ9ELC3_TEGGR|nr:hypothetical protein KUTeg_016584 [Tegillarca granosa]